MGTLYMFAVWIMWSSGRIEIIPSQHLQSSYVCEDQRELIEATMLDSERNHTILGEDGYVISYTVNQCREV